jgi:methionyl-tRNA formyltransferase
MQLEAGLDTGPVYASARVPIGARENAGQLRTRLVDVGTQLLVEHLPDVTSVRPEPQVGEPTYAEKLSVDEFELDPARPAAELDRVVRAGNPRPGAWMRVGGRRVKVLRAHPDYAATPDAAPGAITPVGALVTARDVLALDEVQPEGKRPMPGAAWRAGLRSDARVERS